MKTAQILNRNDSTIRIVDTDTPSIQSGALLVKVKAAGVNFTDLLQRQGSYPQVLPTPYTPGYEVAGEVVEIGSDVSGFNKGDRVMGLLPNCGGFAEYALLPSRLATQLPSRLSFGAATALLTQGLTASILVDLHVQSGSTVLVTAAAGGVGAMTLQLAIARGAQRVYGAAGGRDKAKFIDNMGGVGIDYRLPEWADTLKNQNVQIDTIIDLVGGKVLADAWTLLREFGSIVNCGTSAGEDLRLSAKELTAIQYKNQSLHFYGVSRRLQSDPTLIRRTLDKLISLVVSGALKLNAPQSYALTDAEQALNDLRDRKTQGKVVLDV